MTASCLPLPVAALSSAQWRCLRVVGELGDVAHAARRLHCSQAQLRACLHEMQACMGAQHIVLVGSAVRLSAPLQALLRQRAGAAARLPWP